MNFPSTRQVGFAATVLKGYRWQDFEPHPEWVTPCGTTLLEPQAQIGGFKIDLIDPLIQEARRQDWSQFCLGCPVGTWRERKGNFRLPHAAGIPKQTRVVYISSRDGYDAASRPPSTILQLEEGVQYRAYYWEPSLGVKFDLGRVDRPVRGAVVHEDSFDGQSLWSNPRGEGVFRDGKLIAQGALVATLQGQSLTNAAAAVDIDADTDAGLLLRYQDADNYVAAIYAANDRTIFIRERRAGEDGFPFGVTKSRASRKTCG